MKELCDGSAIFEMTDGRDDNAQRLNQRLLKNPAKILL
jgi:hypothetical protein